MLPDTRRAVRTGVHTVGALVMLAFLGYIIYVIPPEKLMLPALGLIGILFVRELLHGAENITARVKFGASAAGGLTGEIDPRGVLDLKGYEQ